jgi:hypothetical protein
MREQRHPLGKGEVVSSILTGSTRRASICGLFVLAFSVIAQTERRTNMTKIPGTLFGARSRLSGNRPLIFACLRKQTNSRGLVVRGYDTSECQRALANSRRLRPIRRAPIGMRQMAAVIAQLSVSEPVSTIAAFATANNGAWSNMYCSQITKT